MRRWLWITVSWLALGATPALAQPLSVSYSRWIVAGNTVTLRYQLPAAEAQRLTGADVPLLTMSRLEDYLLAHLTVRSAGGECPAIDQGFDLGKVDPLAVGPDQYGFEIFYRCSDPRRLTLRNTALFSQVPNHINFATVQIQDATVLQLFTSGHEELAVPDRGSPVAAGLAAYLRLGFLRVLFSADHWCVLLGALVLMSRARAGAFTVLALAAGYLVALFVSLEGWLRPWPKPLAAFLALIVVLLGAALAQREAQNSRPAVRSITLWIALILGVGLLRAPWAPWTLTGGAVFALGILWLSRASNRQPFIALGLTGLLGFLDGFVPEAALAPAQLSPGQLARVTVGFDLGAVLFGALLVGAAVGIWQLLCRRSYTVPVTVLNDACAAGLSGLGAFWVLSRLG